MNGTLVKCDKTRGHEENNILSSIYIFLFQSTLDDILSNQLNAKHDNGTGFRQQEHQLSITPSNTMRTCVATKHVQGTLIKVLVHHPRLQTGVKLT